MDDFNVSSLHESKNEWGSRLLTILTPLIGEGLKSIFDEAVNLCKSNNEMDKYLMTFQNFISRIPKWNHNIIENEKNRIVDRSGCGYLEDLVTCVHIIQLKLLTAIRVGQKQKKIDITIPKLDDFIHKIYINVARKIYKNVYLFEINIPPLQVQKHNRELEIIVQECILNTVRESIPVESILRAYMDETVEEDVVEEIKEEIIEKPKGEDGKKELEKPHIISEERIREDSKEKEIPIVRALESEGVEIIRAVDTEIPEFPDLGEDTSRLAFSDVDNVREADNSERSVMAPKTMDRLDEISELRNAQRKSEYESDDEDNVRLRIQDQSVNLDNFDVHVLDQPEMNLQEDFLLNDIEVLA
jgi:hypothetical protein